MMHGNSNIKFIFLYDALGHNAHRVNSSASWEEQDSQYTIMFYLTFCFTIREMLTIEKLLQLPKKCKVV
jgi:hypothetical protein